MKRNQSAKVTAQGAGSWHWNKIMIDWLPFPSLLAFTGHLLNSTAAIPEAFAI